MRALTRGREKVKKEGSKKWTDFPTMSEALSFRNSIHKKLINNLNLIEDWFSQKARGGPVPFYSSFDIRDSGLKAACVDANVFPAGFNNICVEDQNRAGSLIKSYLDEKYSAIKTILLLAEEHTRNFYYWDNVFVIKSLIEEAGFFCSGLCSGQTN